MDWCPGCGLEQRQPGHLPFRTVAGLVVLAALLGGVGGYFGAPKRVEVVETVRTVTQTQVVEVEKRVEVQVAAETKTETKVVYRTRVVAPDGTRTETELEATRGTQESRQLVARAEEATRQETQHHTAEMTRHSLTERAAPDWRVGVMVGAPLRLEIPQAHRLAVGVQAERRVLGPVALGGWVVKPITGAPAFGGVLLSVELP